jgi:hypothetical protein
LWKRSSKQGGLLFAIAIVAFGVERIVCVRFRAFNNTIYSGHEVVSVIPWVPAYRWLGYVTAMFLIAAGLCIAANVKARPASILLGILFLLCVLLPITSIWTVRTGSYELLAIGGAALTLAGALPAEGNNPQPWRSSLDWLMKSGRFIFAIALVVFGLDHLLFLRFVASLVPPWIPWHLFWALFFRLRFHGCRREHRYKMDGAVGSDPDRDDVFAMVFRSALTEGIWARRNCGCAAQSK